MTTSTQAPRSAGAGHVSSVRRQFPAEVDGIPAVEATALDVVELWGLESFPASDPPANW